MEWFNLVPIFLDWSDRIPCFRNWKRSHCNDEEVVRVDAEWINPSETLNYLGLRDLKSIFVSR
jgi:hypothetical protein